MFESVFFNNSKKKKKARTRYIIKVKSYFWVTSNQSKVNLKCVYELLIIKEYMCVYIYIYVYIYILVYNILKIKHAVFQRTREASLKNWLIKMRILQGISWWFSG